MRRNWRAAGLVAGAGTGGLALALWWRTHPSACPYAQRLWLIPPRPFITRKRLLALLAPQPGERILDVGVGTGYYALDVAARVQPNGIVCALDLQPKMLERTGTRARQRELTNIELTVGDARALPYPDGQFDGVSSRSWARFPTRRRRCERPTACCAPAAGSLSVVIGDPHMVRIGALQQRAAAAGFRFERRLGRPWGFFARFTADDWPRACT